MFTATTNIRVRYAETDQMDVVYYGNYAQYFEVGRAESIRNLGFTYKDMEINGVMMPVVEMQCRYLRPAHYDDLLTVKTTLRELPTDHRIEFHHEVYNEQGKLLTSGKVVLFFSISNPKLKLPCHPPSMQPWPPTSCKPISPLPTFTSRPSVFPTFRLSVFPSSGLSDFLSSRLPDFPSSRLSVFP
ncbi:thioesterase family protein [Paraflavitalea speifideaquila]|uniref:acyl-CoA thioesterase n=1 Tax=Paraflavitalea speifideaquila TaxID=3076558 RepID=UPI0028E1C945|nr:thioesterase family protein [Paraflavitalea speifideiaquila]